MVNHRTACSELRKLNRFCLFDLLLYVQGKKLRSCRDSQLPTLFMSKSPGGSLPVLSAHSFASY